MDLHSPRLDLLLITHDELFALEHAPTDEVIFTERSFTNPFGVLTRERIPHANRIADVRANPDNIKWYYRLIVLRESDELIGSISFHGPPDGNGMIEVGLGIASERQGLGFATEALRGLWSWAAQQTDVTVVRYTVSPDNAPSQAMISRYPCDFLGQQIDEEDGPEDIYEIPTERLREFLAQA